MIFIAMSTKFLSQSIFFTLLSHINAPGKVHDDVDRKMENDPGSTHTLKPQRQSRSNSQRKEELQEKVGIFAAKLTLRVLRVSMSRCFLFSCALKMVQCSTEQGMGLGTLVQLRRTDFSSNNADVAVESPQPVACFVVQGFAYCVFGYGEHDWHVLHITFRCL